MMKRLLILFFCLTAAFAGFSQGGILGKARSIGTGNRGNATNNTGKPGTAGKDTTDGKLSGLGFEHRDDAKDSVNIVFRYLDSVRNNKMDSSINDFGRYFPLSAYYQYLGNNGSAAYSLVYSPVIKAGWDPGFHAFDVYRYTLENTKFYKTSKPFTQIGYQLASGKEQVIKILHTQNPVPQLNFGFDYRLINAPGFFVTQNTIHNNYRIFSNYQGKRKRYAAYFILQGNSIKNSENGGIKNDSFLLKTGFSQRFSIPTNLGMDSGNIPNPFRSSVTTGNIYKDVTVFLRQCYDIGKKDSMIINDTTVEYLFYSKLRIQHTFTFSNYTYRFNDYRGDSAIYKNWYNIDLPNYQDTVLAEEKWKVLSNDLYLLQFPDTRNLAQYLLAGATLQNISGVFTKSGQSFHNIILHGEYVNKTRNRKWDILARGELYLSGLNSGDYSFNANLARFFNKRWGNVRLSFLNVNRSPSFIFTGGSSFHLGNEEVTRKENITMLRASADNSFFSLAATNYLITNLAFFKNYYEVELYSKVINLLQLSASKKIRLYRHWNWYAELVLQQTDAAAPVRVPLLFTRNRFAFEGLFYKNLNLSTGLECRYFTSYKAYGYSPLAGQFFPQDGVTISNRPDIAAFLHFRIKSFTGYIRAENLNTMDFSNGFGFIHNNLAAPLYPYPGFIFRFGILWNFVN